MSGARTSRRAWGWHRLTDTWAGQIVDDAHVRPGELVLDIGAGHGALTAPLVDAGARVLAVEPHPARAALLRERFSAAQVTVLEITADELRLPHRPFRVVANPPYAITAALLRALLTTRSGLYAADVVLQRAVVRHHAGVRYRGWTVRQGSALPRRAFDPPPRVDSAVLVIRRRH